MYIRPFDPWRNRFCTCPPKYSLNPYTGCSHGCIYCYASSYIRNFFICRPKKNLIETLKREIEKIPGDSLLSLSNTSDPYPPMEFEKEITRECLKIIKNREIRLLIVTKSDIVGRDLDLLRDMKVAVTITITTLAHSNRLEPAAPSPLRRLKALERLNKEGIPTGLRLDPIIPFINEVEIERILMLSKEKGISHVTLSTFKPRWDSWKRLITVFPEYRDKLAELYFRRGEKIGNSRYLPQSIREKILGHAVKVCESLGLTWSFCRENLDKFMISGSCDGSHLIRSGGKSPLKST